MVFVAGRGARDQVPPNCAEEQTEQGAGGRHVIPSAAWGTGTPDEGLPPPGSGAGTKPPSPAFTAGHAGEAAGGAPSRPPTLPRAESCTWQAPGPHSRRLGRGARGPGPPGGRPPPARAPRITWLSCTAHVAYHAMITQLPCTGHMTDHALIP